MDLPDGKGIKGVFTNKVGPFPAYVWSGGAVAIYVIYRYMKDKRTPAATTEVVDPSGQYPAASDGSDYLGNLAKADTSYGGTSAITTPDQAVADNQSWFRQATNWLIGQGMNPTDVLSAIGAYINGSTDALNSTQTALLNSALAKFGAAPEGTLTPPPTTTVPTPTTPEPWLETSGPDFNPHTSDGPPLIVNPVIGQPANWTTLPTNPNQLPPNWQNYVNGQPTPSDVPPVVPPVTELPPNWWVGLNN